MSDDNYQFVPVPVGLVKRLGPAHSEPVLAMRAHEDGHIEVTCNGSYWERADLISGRWQIP